MGRIRRLGLVLVLGLVTACNPISFDPQVSYPGFEVGRVQVTGPQSAWIESSVTGTEGTPSTP